jgi:hypothetical protein
MKRIAKILLIAFVLNFIWEASQSFLYAPHFEGVGGLIKVHLRASLGDIFLVFLILALDIFIFGKLFSQKNLRRSRIIFIIFAGLIAGVAVEKYALAAGRWSYNDLMPIIPILGVGLAPSMQMTLIPALAIFLVSLKEKMAKK